MPPRYAYWTIIVDHQPTAFRSGSQEELMPTFKRLKAKNDTAVMMWFQNGKLWPSRIDAQEAMRARGEMGRRSDERQAGFRDRERRPSRQRADRDDGPAPAPRARTAGEKLDWKPKGEFVPAPKRSERPEWKPKTGDRAPRTSRAEKPEGKPKGSFDRERKPEWKAKSDWGRTPQAQSQKPFRRPAYKPSGDDSRSAKPASRSEKPEWRPRSSGGAAKSDWKPRTDRSERPQWTPKSPASGPQSAEAEKRKWVPKEEYKKSMGIEARRDKNWRPGGEHKDPRQKYKDAKKAKWSRFKQNIRARSGGKGKKSS